MRGLDTMKVPLYTRLIRISSIRRRGRLGMWREVVLELERGP